jgi:ribosomal protein S18 acetylase RimI-like enzyme
MAQARDRHGSPDTPQVRRATPADAADIGRLFYDFNAEFSQPTPDADLAAERYERLLENGDAVILLAGSGPDGFAQLRFRPSVYAETLDAYLEELYVAPAKRGRGMGRALLEAAMDAAREEGAGRIDLGTSEDDVAARALYESAGFTNREGGTDGPVMFVYEREL